MGDCNTMATKTYILSNIKMICSIECAFGLKTFADTDYYVIIKFNSSDTWCNFVISSHLTMRYVGFFGSEFL